MTGRLTADGLLSLLKEKATFVDPECADRFASYSAKDFDRSVGCALKALLTGSNEGRIRESSEVVAAGIAALLVLSQLLHDEPPPPAAQARRARSRNSKENG